MKSNTRKADEGFAAIAIAALLIFTAWGNATGMLILSIIGIGFGLPGLLVVKRNNLHSLAFITTVTFALAASVAIAIVLGRTH